MSPFTATVSFVNFKCKRKFAALREEGVCVRVMGTRVVGLLVGAALLGSFAGASAALAQSAPPPDPEIVTLPVNVFIVGDTSSVLARDPTFSSPTDLLGVPGEQARQLVARALAGVNRMWDRCAVRFEQNTLGVVAARRLVLPGGRTLLQERKEFRSYFQILPRLANEELPSGVRVYRAINLFFVDALPGVRGRGTRPTGAEATVSVVVWRSLGVIPSRTIAHEFGHNLGLAHVERSEDRDNVMVSGGRGRRLNPEQCREARLWARALNRSARPRILSLSAPERVPVGEELALRVVFRDLDRDLAFAVVESLAVEEGSGVLRSRSRLFTPDVKGSAVGLLTLRARCREPGLLRLRVLLLDELSERASASLLLRCVREDMESLE